MSIHFVIPPAFAEQIAALPDQVLGEDYPYWLGGRFNWVAQSWLVLRQFREGLSVGAEPKADAINFAHVMGWRSFGVRAGEFRVSMRADYPRLFDVDFEILQNPVVRTSANQAYLPYWPVPGLIPRDRARKGLKTLAYAGRIGPLNLAGGLVEKTSVVSDYDFRVIEPHLWHDLSEIDALVAIRSFDTAPHNSKPPSKLFSAWRAGVPLIAGWDSAFSSVGTPDVDYIRVQSDAEFQSALTRLARDPEYYNGIVAAGHKRAQGVSHDAIADVWLNCIDTQITPAFERWHAQGPSQVRGVLARSADEGRDMLSRAKRALQTAKGAP